VALLGVLQYFLPKDLLSHLGYGLERGARSAFFIDDNPTLPRIMSTLREPNALGAYLLLPITFLTLLFARIRDKRRLLLGGMLTLHLLALFLTFSRSAWLAAILAVSIVLWFEYRKNMAILIKRFWPLLVGLVLLGSLALFMQRDSSFVQHYITHSTEETLEDLDSNDYHKLLVWQAAIAVVDQPFGHGPGTAGLASIQNPAGANLTENYYLQVIYEVGIIGLLVFIALSVVAYYRLAKRRDWLGTVLLASFWGYVLMNMLLHTWSNEAVAAQWWLVAGAALALPVRSR
jgi:O-antigen ligase